MADVFSVECIEGRALVTLKVARNFVDMASDRLQLATPGRTTDCDPSSLWIGPNQWLLASDALAATNIIDHCGSAMAGLLHHAVDQTSALVVYRVSGVGARDLLACGTGIDLRPARFPVGACHRTRLAQIASIIVLTADNTFDLLVDRSYGSYMRDWLLDHLGTAARTA